ncbi:hypothetical protein N7474_004503 [Penicillium riverlandense]|uniref:uncharacterized protein n=1 Tax=Penicillium riverlandense TaxID=1903569 RepID=UPI002549B4E4|nr:uncharacterized protein N7474_004503 [Penicillium riverlandense]KAJ5818912.1 hypothetical protein N7474_004503 [Penicillium riverlandense]
MTEKQASESGEDASLRYASSEVVLIPQPTNDPADPLNWPMSKKVFNLGLISFAALIGVAQALANQSGFFVQAALYHKSATQLTYSISAAIAGLASGPFMWSILAQRIGRSSCIFWGLLLTMACGIWSAEMTDPDQYIAFVISRWLGGTFGSVACTIGAGTVLDMFYLHQRGKAFACYALCTLFGTQLGPTLSGFIIARTTWPVQFWWTVGLEGAMAVLIFLFLEETGFSRDGKLYPSRPEPWFQNRIATFFPGTAVVPQSKEHGRRSSLDLLLVALCPVTLIAGLFLFIAFGWAVAVTTLLSVFLEGPVKTGGYGFSGIQMSCFYFVQWVSIAAAEIYGMYFNDRIPLWYTRRYHKGVWKPEHRLYPLLVLPALLLPIGLGLFGAGLQYHLHYMVLALGQFLLNFSEIAIVPVIFTYVAECFTDHGPEVVTVLNCWRLILGLTVPFFITAWEERVGAGWVFGMMAFFSIFAFSLTGLLAWKGPSIRGYSFTRLRKSEDGTKVIDQR